jgi:hypothetical protein
MFDLERTHGSGFVASSNASNRRNGLTDLLLNAGRQDGISMTTLASGHQRARNELTISKMILSALYNWTQLDGAGISSVDLPDRTDDTYSRNSLTARREQIVVRTIFFSGQ